MFRSPNLFSRVSVSGTPDDEPVVGIGPFTTPIPTLVPLEARTNMLPAESNAMSPLLAAELFPVGRRKVAIVPLIGVFVLVLKPYTVAMPGDVDVPVP